MKKLFLVLFAFIAFILFTGETGCESGDIDSKNKTAVTEQNLTEQNQKRLIEAQPPPGLDWSLERDNLIKRSQMMNDRSMFFYMYVFIEGVQEPIGYYQVNKVSSVNSQLTNTEQCITSGRMEGWAVTLPSPAEDGSYGTNGDGVFGFTPENIYIEHNMKYIVSAVPLTFTKPVNRLAIISVETQKQLNEMMDRIEKNNVNK